MAFAAKNNNAFLTEKDLCRQVASNQTKAKLIAKKEDESVTGKQMMADNMAKVLRVWSAFTKFIKSQTSKGKTVDT